MYRCSETSDRIGWRSETTKVGPCCYRTSCRRTVSSTIGLKPEAFSGDTSWIISSCSDDWMRRKCGIIRHIGITRIRNRYIKSHICPACCERRSHRDSKSICSERSIYNSSLGTRHSSSYLGSTGPAIIDEWRTRSHDIYRNSEDNCMDPTRCEIPRIGNSDRILREEIGRERSFWRTDTRDQIRNIPSNIRKYSPLDSSTIGDICSGSEVPVHSVSDISRRYMCICKVSTARDTSRNRSIGTSFICCPCRTTYISKCGKDIRDTIVDSDCLTSCCRIVSSIVRISSRDRTIIGKIKSYICCIGRWYDDTI